MKEAWPLVGRVEELALVLDSVRSPDGRGVVIAGSLGVGKTRLARHAAEELRADGAVEWLGATPGSAEVPYLVLAHLLPKEAGSGPDSQARLVRGVREALVARAGGRPTILVVDDVQWLDRASAATLHQLVLTGAAKVILTLRVGEPIADPVVSMWKDGLVERLELQPLTTLDVDELVVSVLEHSLDSESRQHLWRLSEGNPLFVHELVTGAIETGAFTGSEGVWHWSSRGLGPATRLSAILGDRLGRLGAPAREVLNLLAVGEPLPVELILRVGHADGLVDAERSGLVVERDVQPGQCRLVHPIYGEVLRAAMTTVERQRLTAQLADLFEPTAGTSRAQLLRVARWRVESGTAAAPGLLTDAAEAANAVYDHVLAERLARRAVADEGGLRASLALGDALNRQGRCLEGLVVLDPLTALARTDREHLDVAVSRYFGLTTEHGFRPEFAAGLFDAERLVEDPAAARFLRAQRATLLSLSGELEEGTALAAAVAAEGDEISALRAVPALGGGWLVDGRPDAACELASRMFEVAFRHQEVVAQGPAWVLSIYLPSLVASGRLDEADEAFDFVEALAGAHGASADGPSFLAFARGLAALQRGQALTAVRLLQEGVAGLRPIAAWRLPFALSQLAEACSLSGDPDGAVAASAEADELITHARVLEGMVRRARGWVAVSQGQRSLATERFVDAAAWAGRHGQHTSRFFALHDALRLGEVSVTADLLGAAAVFDGRWAEPVAGHAIAVREDDGAGLEQVAASFESIGALLLAAEATIEAAASFTRAGLRARAERATARARVLTSLCEGARTPRLADLDEPVALTRREREVVHLATAGLSSGVIAARLFVSTRTVEGHLHRAYAKLGVSDRAGLKRLLAHDAPEPLP